MPSSCFRFFYNDEPATQDQLDSIESITVQQEIDMAWEARLTIPIYTNHRGVWQGENERYMRRFSRVRVEIKVGNSGFVPLIEGPVVNNDSPRNAQPGQSQVTLIVHDDSIFLNREDQLMKIEKETDSEIAKELFSSTHERIKPGQIDPTPVAPKDLERVTVLRGTPMSLLRTMAKRQGMHAYVLPGERPGHSLGYFKELPRRDSGLPDLVLLGPDRNLEEFNISQDAQSPARVRSSALNIRDHAMLRSKSSFRDLNLLGDVAAFGDDEKKTALLYALPGLGNLVDLARRVKGEAERSSYDLTATGSVVADSYPGVLTPYRLVQVCAIGTEASGSYLVHHVTHTFDRSSYSQSFTLKRNARSEPASGASNNMRGRIV